MKKYTEGKECELMLVCCNLCGRELKVENGILKEGCFHGENKFGYFSTKDNELHSFDLCENCYRKMIAQFRIPVDVEPVEEFL